MKIILLFLLASTSYAQIWPFGGSGDAKRIQGKNVVAPLTCDDGDQLTWVSSSNRFECAAAIGGGGSEAGAVKLYEAVANGTNFVAWKAADSLGADTTYLIPSTPPSGDQVLQCGTPSGGVSTCTFVTGGGSSTKTYTFQGINQGDTPAWNVNYRTLTNMVFSTLDATHIRPLIVVTANTTGSGLWTVTPVTTTNPTPNFIVSARSTDGTNAGSMDLAYACVPSGDSIDNPSYTSLTALSLTTIDPDSEVFQSSQAVTCTGTESAPADLYVKWTPTAPSGGTLSLIKLMLIY